MAGENKSSKGGSPTTLNQKLVLIFLSVLLALIILEVGIRTRDALFKSRGFFSNHRNQLTNIPPLLPFRTFGPRFYREKDGVPYIVTRNNEQFPLEKPPGVFRIVCFERPATSACNEADVTTRPCCNRF